MIPTFKNLKFRPHQIDSKCIRASLELKPNITLSVVAGPGMYSLPGGSGDRSKFDEYPDSNDFSSFEVMVIDETLSNDAQADVIGWQSREDINNLIVKIING